MSLKDVLFPRLPIPRIIADADTAASIKGSLPEGSAVSRMDAVSLDATNLVFVSELDLDGLFGFHTAEHLVRTFGKVEMLFCICKTCRKYAYCRKVEQMFRGGRFFYKQI